MDEVSHDFGHSRDAVANRRRKVASLHHAAVTIGVLADQLAGDGEAAAAVRRQVLKECASVQRASAETWAMVAARLQDDPPKLADPGTRSACGCTANDAGVLMEFPGWPCPHPDPSVAAPQLPTGTIACGPRRPPSEADVAAIADFGAALRARAARPEPADDGAAALQEAARLDELARGRVVDDVASSAEEWWS